MTFRTSYRVTGVGLLLVVGGWLRLLTVDYFWHPLAFTVLWTGVALVALTAVTHSVPDRTARMVAVSTDRKSLPGLFLLCCDLA